MSTQVFKTPPDSPHSVEIFGVGALGPNGHGGVPVEVAAQTMPELQERDANGVVKLDGDGKPKPLSGQKLKEAAKELADRLGWHVESVADDKVPLLAQEWGAVPDRPPADQVAVEEGEKLRAELARHDSKADVDEAVEATHAAQAASTESGQEATQ